MELWTTMRLWWEFGAAVRGACFSSVTFGPDQEAEMSRLHRFMHATFNEMKELYPTFDKAFFPLVYRHLHELCYCCGRKDHWVKVCAQIVTADTCLGEVGHRYMHVPAEFSREGGPYWNEAKLGWERRDFNRKKNKTSYVSYFVRHAVGDRYTVQLHGEVIETRNSFEEAVAAALVAALAHGSASGAKRTYAWASGLHDTPDANGMRKKKEKP